MKKMIMAGNTHFDPVWLWQWDEALSSITATLKAALQRMDEYDDFTYSFSAPAVLEWIRNTDEELFNKIKKRIEEGRWELCEGWWLQADCNAAHGESYVRQGLYTQKYYVEHFGRKSKTVFNIDSFGHPQSIVQLMAGCDIENYVFWRPNEEHKSLKSPLFNWLGANSTSVKTYRIGGEGGEIFTADITKDTLNPLIESADGTDYDYLVVYGVTDHGGAPTIEMIEKIKAASVREKQRMDIHFGTVEEYFGNVDKEKIVQLDDELCVKFIGPYSNFTEIKKNNRSCEHMVMKAEIASVIAQELINKPYPSDKLREIWKDIMFNQFHDILGGCCTEDAFFDARNLHGRALEGSKEILHFAIQGITNKIRMPGRNPDNEWNLVIWNFNSFEADTMLEAEVQWAWEFDWYRGEISLCDADGNEVPCQVIAEKPVLPGFRSRFVFRAKIPPVGYKCFIVRKKAAECEIKRRYMLKDNGNGDFSLYDAVKDKTVLTKLLVPYVRRDICDTWGFNKTVYEDEKEFLTLKSVTKTEDGCIREAYRLLWEYNKSTLEQIITVCDEFVDCSFRALWNEEGCALKLMLSDGCEKACIASTPYGSIKREATVYEHPVGEWITLSDGENKISAVSDSVFAYSFDGTELGLTILRNCLFGDLRTEPLDESRFNRYMGQGVTSGKIRLVFDKNESREAALVNNAPVILCEANHDGIFECENSFAGAISECTDITAVKRAEDGDGYVLRLFNYSDKCDNVKAEFFGLCTELSMNPGEVSTIRVKNNKFIKTNMLEEDEGR